MDTLSMRKTVVLCLSVLILLFLFTKTGDTQNYLPVQSVQYDSGKTIRLPSPDGRFIVFCTHFEDHDAFTLHQKTTNGNRHCANLLQISGFQFVDGFTWLPEHPDTLVLGVRQTDGPPYIALWNGKTPTGKLTVLRRGTLPTNQDPDMESLSLTGVSRNGKSIAYQHEKHWLDRNESRKESQKTRFLFL